MAYFGEYQYHQQVHNGNIPWNAIQEDKFKKNLHKMTLGSKNYAKSKLISCSIWWVVSLASFFGFFFNLFCLFSLGLCLQLCLLQMCHGYVLIQRSVPGKNLTTVFALRLFVDPLVAIVDSFDVLDAMRLSPKHSVAARPSAGDRLVSFHPLRPVAVHGLYVCP